MKSENLYEKLTPDTTRKKVGLKARRKALKENCEDITPYDAFFVIKNAQLESFSVR